jgi:hypothetical protein
LSLSQGGNVFFWQLPASVRFLTRRASATNGSVASHPQITLTRY